MPAEFRLAMENDLAARASSFSHTINGVYYRTRSIEMVDRRRLAPKLVDLILIGGMRIGFVEARW